MPLRITKPNNRRHVLPDQLRGQVTGAVTRRGGHAVHPDALLFTEIIKVANSSWLFRWTGAPDFQIYLNGTLRLTTSDTEIVVDASDTEEPPALEILDANNTNTAQNILYPPHLNLQFYGDVNADSYIIEELDDGEWVQRTVISETAEGYYTHQTEALIDLSDNNWRVRALTAAGNTSAAETFGGLIVRNPPPPSITMVYSGGTLNVIER